MATATFRRYSGSAAELYEEVFVPLIATPAASELLRVADLRPGERVVDLACGTGVVARAAAERVGTTGSVTGVDLAPDMLEVARRVPAGGAPITWEQGDMASLPLPDGCCDVVLCQMGLMFVEDKVAPLREAHRILAPGGRIVVSTPGPIQPLFASMEQAFVDHLDPSLGIFVAIVFSLPDPAQLVELLAAAGFEDPSGASPVTRLDLPEPAEFLWSYINLTPMGPLVAPARQEAKEAMEEAVVAAWEPSVVDGRTPLDQPIAIAWARRS